jgi:starch synthase (maltosyl-transferring)
MTGKVEERHAAMARRRVMIEGVSPRIDCGRFPIKRVTGESVVVEADVFADGHDAVACALLHRHEDDRDWSESPMRPLVSDRWRASFDVHRMGRYNYTVIGWIDAFLTWHRDLRKRVDAGQDVAVDLLIGAAIVEAAAGRAAEAGAMADADRLLAAALRLRQDTPQGSRIDLALSDELALLVHRHPDRRHATRLGRELEVAVDSPRSRFSTWYELFPRSAAGGRRHGTFRDVEARLDYVAGMGFDVLYLPPIHPIGRVRRKGPNNAQAAEEGDVGSPWGIGAAEGGHMGIHPELGTPEEFRALVRTARERGIEIALDIAFQAAPDHPWVEQHPRWFRQRPDGTIQYAENPPKKYQDIYPFEFDTDDWQPLWEELEAVFEHWIGEGVRIFRVDNPHTKSFRFWEWCIGRIRARHPDVIFLSEAFTRPRPMYRLAKLGFNQSYTYFAWRNAKWELEEYFTELTRTEVAEYFRPNVWPNTPDILTRELQTGLRQVFMQRIVLAGTLAASYGIYGPAFELMEHLPLIAGKEEYLHSEKYEIRDWDLDRADSLAPFIARVNAIRHANAALQTNAGLRFHEIANDSIIAYSKRWPVPPEPVSGAPPAPEELAPPDNVILTVVNLDPHATQAGMVRVPLDEWGLHPDHPYQVYDVLGDARYTWQGEWNYVELNPHVVPAHIFRLEPPR